MSVPGQRPLWCWQDGSEALAPQKWMAFEITNYLGQLHDLVRYGTSFIKETVLPFPQWMRARRSMTPIGKAKVWCWLFWRVVIGKQITNDVFEWNLLGNKTRKGCLSFISCPRWALKSIQMMFFIWNPTLSHSYHFSVPIFWSLIMTSPLCLESNLAKRSTKFNGFDSRGLIMIELPCSPTVFEIVAGKRRPRLLPHCFLFWLIVVMIFTKMFKRQLNEFCAQEFATLKGWRLASLRTIDQGFYPGDKREGLAQKERTCIWRLYAWNSGWRFIVNHSNSS